MNVVLEFGDVLERIKGALLPLVGGHQVVDFRAVARPKVKREDAFGIEEEAASVHAPAARQTHSHHGRTPGETRRVGVRRPKAHLELP